MIAPKDLPQLPPRSVVRARHATKRRTRRARFRGYAVVVRIAVVGAVLMVPIMVYLMLMSNLTGANYALAQAVQQRTALVEETTRLDDRIAQLQSRERLSALAAQLHMHDPHRYAVVDIPRPLVTPPPTGIAFLGTLFRR